MIACLSPDLAVFQECYARGRESQPGKGILGQKRRNPEPEAGPSEPRRSKVARVSEASKGNNTKSLHFNFHTPEITS